MKTTTAKIFLIASLLTSVQAFGQEQSASGNAETQNDKGRILICFPVAKCKEHIKVTNQG